MRAAVEMREAGAALSAELERERGVGIGMKLAVESGEVFLERRRAAPAFAAGDAFNVAARLEGLAPEGEILLGENTYPLVRDSVRVEALEPLALKGRSAKVQAWRLLGLAVDDPARPPAPREPVRRARARARRAAERLRAARATSSAARR